LSGYSAASRSRECHPGKQFFHFGVSALRQADAGQGEPVTFLVEIEILAKQNLIGPMGRVLEIPAG
jgi:hypothetical protein